MKGNTSLSCGMCTSSEFQIVTTSEQLTSSRIGGFVINQHSKLTYSTILAKFR